jgi:hypothetical protein
MRGKAGQAAREWRGVEVHREERRRRVERRGEEKGKSEGEGDGEVEHLLNGGNGGIDSLLS